MRQTDFNSNMKMKFNKQINLRVKTHGPLSLGVKVTHCGIRCRQGKENNILWNKMSIGEGK